MIGDLAAGRAGSDGSPGSFRHAENRTVRKTGRREETYSERKAGETCGEKDPYVEFGHCVYPHGCF